MFGVGLPELVLLVVLAVVLFGPEKVPEYSRKAARVVHYLSTIANQAQNQLRAELGPEYADLQLKDLAPRALIQKHVIDAIQGDLDQIKADLSDVRGDLEATRADLAETGRELAGDVDPTDSFGRTTGGLPPFDAEAT